MLTCSFLGHSKLYDPNIKIYGNLNLTIRKLIMNHDEIEFLIYQMGTYHMGEFYNLCLAAIMEAKQRYPVKKFIFTKIKDPKIGNDLCEKGKVIPDYFYDKTIAPFDNYTTIHLKQILRWIISKSHLLLCYIYKDFYDYNSEYEYAQKNNLTIFNMIDTDTEEYITRSINLLSEREQFIINKMNNGHSFRAIGELYKISGTAIRQSNLKARFKLKKFALDKLQQNANEPYHPVVCGILLLTLPTADIIKAVNQTCYFLIQQYNVSVFLIEQKDFHQMPTIIWQDIIKRNPSIRFKIITHYSREIQLEWGAPPFNDILNIDPQMIQWTSLKAVKYLLNNADFLVCHLDPKSPLSENIKKHIQKTEQLKVFNIKL